MMNGRRIVVLGAFEFVPSIIGFAVAVLVAADHHNTRFGATIRLIAGHRKRITKDAEVIAVFVLYGVVKAEGDVSTPSSETNETAGIVGNRQLTFATHRSCIIALFILRQNIHKLPHRGYILIHSRDIRRVFGGLYRRGVGIQIISFADTAEVSRYVSCTRRPVLLAVVPEAMQHTRRYVVLGVRDIKHVGRRQESVRVLERGDIYRLI